MSTDVEAVKERAEVEIGEAVTYVDQWGRPHTALVTNKFGGRGAGYTGEPSLNVVFTTTDPAMQDQYGRQLARSTSCIYRSSQPAHGNYWKYLDEA